MGAGVVLNLACVGIALSVELMHFVSALLLGVGWNFLFTGSTTLALAAYRPGKGPRAGGHQLLRVRHHVADLVRLGRAGHHAGLGLAEPRLAGAAGGGGGGWAGWGCASAPHWPLEPTMPRWLEHRIPRP
jgi:hypothetical protein